MDEGLIRRRWRSYFHKLLNETGDAGIVLGDLEHSERHYGYGYYKRIKSEKVRGAIRRICKGRATGQVRFLWIFGRAQTRQVWSD